MTSPGSRPGSVTVFGHGTTGPIPPGLVAPRSRAAFPARPAQRWRRVFPGHEAELRPMRQWLAGLLPGTPARDDVIVVSVELATNAVKHTASGRGGFFAVEITWHAQPAIVRIAVADGGAPTGPRTPSGPDPLSDHGRGLQVVRGLASRTGVCGDRRGRLVWADVPWIGGTPADSDYPAGYEAALRDGQARLAAEHSEAVTWFGRATLQWWALTGHLGARHLITAPSAEELAEKLGDRRASRSRRRITAGPRIAPRATALNFREIGPVSGDLTA